MVLLGDKSARVAAGGPSRARRPTGPRDGNCGERLKPAALTASADPRLAASILKPTVLRTSRRAGLALLAACLAGLILTATGCGTSESGAVRQAEAVVPIPTVLDSSHLVLPIEPYMFTDRDMTTLQQAQAALARSCMTRFGFDWHPTTPGSETGTVDAANTAHRYGLTDPKAAAAYGYHYTGPGSGTPKAADTAVLTAAEAPVLTGAALDGSEAPTTYRGITIPAGGCLGEASLNLSGQPGVLGDGALVTNINIGSYDQSYSDARVTAAFQMWSACMKTKGFDYPNPTAAPGKDPKFSAATPSPLEIAIAQSDVACKQQTNLVGVWYAVDSAYQDVAVAHNAKALSGIKQRIVAELAKARGVLSGTQPTPQAFEEPP